MNSPQLQSGGASTGTSPGLTDHAGLSLTVGIVRLFTESMAIIIVISTTAVNETKHIKETRERMGQHYSAVSLNHTHGSIYNLKKTNTGQG